MSGDVREFRVESLYQAMCFADETGYMPSMEWLIKVAEEFHEFMVGRRGGDVGHMALAAAVSKAKQLGANSPSAVIKAATAIADYYEKVA